MPTLRTTLGVKGQRPVVGTWDNKDLVYAFAALEVVGGRLTTRLLDSPARAKATTGKSKTRRLQEAFASHLRDIARRYPRQWYSRVVVIIDNAPWHRGRVLRRRATHNRLFDTMAALRRALRASLCYYQTLRHKVLSLIEDPRKASKTGAA